MSGHTFTRIEDEYIIPIYYSVKILIFTDIRNIMTIKKENKIMVVIAPSSDERELFISRLAVRLGFAKVPSDAKKIIRKDIYSFDLPTAYFILCSNYNFRGSVITTQRLYELAARGICVVVGVKSLPREYELISQVFYPDDLR